MSLWASAPTRLAWRGLGWAGVLALLLHLVAWELAKSSFDLSFQAPSAGALRVRLIADSALSIPNHSPPALASVVTPELPPPAPHTPPANTSAALAAVKPAPAQRKALPVGLAKSLKPNQPLASVDTARSAINSIANEDPLRTTPSSHAVTSAPSSLPTVLPTSPTTAPTASGAQLIFPPSVQMQFDARVMRKGQATAGTGALSWKSDGSGYEMRLEVSLHAQAQRLDKSVGKITAQGLAPERFSSAGNGRSVQATHFRAELGKIQFSNNQPEEALLLGAQDRLSVLMQLAGILGGDTGRDRSAEIIRLQVADLDTAQVWEFKSIGVSAISLPAATLPALLLTREPRHAYDTRWEIWLSPQLGYLPVRIRQSSFATPDLDFTDLTLRKMP